MVVCLHTTQLASALPGWLSQAIPSLAACRPARKLFLPTDATFIFSGISEPLRRSQIGMNRIHLGLSVCNRTSFTVIHGSPMRV